MNNPVKALPDYIEREAVREFLSDLDLVPQDIHTFKLKNMGIEVTVIHRDAEGRRVIGHEGPVMSRVFIPIRNNEPWGKETDKRTTKVRRYVRTPRTKYDMG